jgi:hypothetical protein
MQNSAPMQIAEGLRDLEQEFHAFREGPIAIPIQQTSSTADKLHREERTPVGIESVV